MIYTKSADRLRRDLSDIGQYPTTDGVAEAQRHRKALIEETKELLERMEAADVFAVFVMCQTFSGAAMEKAKAKRRSKAKDGAVKTLETQALRGPYEPRATALPGRRAVGGAVHPDA